MVIKVTKNKIMTIAGVFVIAGITLISRIAGAQDEEGNKITEPTTIEEQAPTRSPWLGVGLPLGITLVVSGIGGGMLAAKPNYYESKNSVGIAGLAILGSGLVFGPSIGRIYSGWNNKATWFILGRMASVGLIAAGNISYVMSDFHICFDNCTPSRNDSLYGAGIAMVVIGSLGLAALTVLDTVDSYNSVKKFNEEHAKKSISVSPFVMPSSSRTGENGTAYGLAVGGRF